MKKNMKGIVLAGGRATRLDQLTKVISKQLLPVYIQPMVYYPIKTLIDMGITDILVIVSSELQLQLFKAQLGDGSRYGGEFTYIVQDAPRGIADAFRVGELFIGNSDVTLILGDNVFLLNRPISPTPNTIYLYKVRNPSAYGVATLNDYGELVDIVEKPKDFVSDNAVVGLYVFTNQVLDFVKLLNPSERGELEITDLIKLMMEGDYVEVEEIDGVWFDCGTHDDLLECAEYVRALAKRTTHAIFLSEV